MLESIYASAHQAPLFDAVDSSSKHIKLNSVSFMLCQFPYTSRALAEKLLLLFVLSALDWAQAVHADHVAESSYRA